MSEAHVVLDLAVAEDGTLEVVRAGIYGSDHHGLTRNLKLVGATVVSMKADSYTEACEKCMAYVAAMLHAPAWKRLYDMLCAREAR